MNIKHIIAFAAAALILTACGSSKKAAEKSELPLTETTVKPAETPQVAEQPQSAEIQQKDIVERFVSDLEITVGMGRDSYTLGGKISMKRGKVMRLNLTFMGFIEVGIIEFTPDGILIVNRMGREYTRIAYDGMDALIKNNITYDSIEQQAWEKLYVDGGKRVNTVSLDKAIENLINSNLKDGKKVSVRIDVGQPDTKHDFTTYTIVKSSYTEVPPQVLMARLMSFAK